jgi:ABC-type Fe3+/spermidine/putrescine transport system ATPase subunit
MLRVVRLEGFEERFPRQLSGGQQQRVALARALVNRPAALLLDEPLSALDVKLRKQMQQELKSIQHALRTTFIYVTHDQEEALSMSDRIGVMNDGHLLQIGSPREIYERPIDDFVASFIGLLNVLSLRVDEVAGGMAIGRPNDGDRVSVRVSDEVRAGEVIKVAVRPERVAVDSRDGPARGSGSHIQGVVADITYLGSATQFHVDSDSFGRVVSHRMNEGELESLAAGSRVALSWPLDAALVLLTNAAPPEP